MEDHPVQEPKPRPWLLVSSHGLVLFYIATHPDDTMWAISEALGLTQRRVISIVRDLAQAGLVRVEKYGRRNRYILEEDAHFRHPTMASIKVSDFLRVMGHDHTSPGR